MAFSVLVAVFLGTAVPQRRAMAATAATQPAEATSWIVDLEVAGTTTIREQLLLSGGTRFSLRGGRARSPDELRPGDVLLDAGGRDGTVVAVRQAPPLAPPTALGAARVVGILTLESDRQMAITTAHGSVTATPEHPFWVSRRGWVGASRLRAGDVLDGRDGPVAVDSVTERHVAPYAVHNLVVEGVHTFRVGPDALLVHNGLVDACTSILTPVVATGFDYVVKPVVATGFNYAVKPAIMAAYDRFAKLLSPGLVDLSGKQLYHATLAANLKSIEKNGLDPEFGASGMGASSRGHVQSLKDTMEAHSKGFIHFTATPWTADMYVEHLSFHYGERQAARGGGGHKVVVLTWKAPKNTKAFRDQDSMLLMVNFSQSYKTDVRIPPEGMRYWTQEEFAMEKRPEPHPLDYRPRP